MTARELPPAETLVRELETLRERVAAQGDPHLEEALESLGTAVEQLRVAEAELQRQHEQLGETQLELAEERRRYADLFELAPDAYLVTDPVGKVLEANRRASELFAYDHRFLLGKPFTSMLEQAARPAFRAWLVELAQAQAPERRELRLRRRGGVTLDASVTVSPELRPHSGEVVALRWIVRDVSEERQSERQLWELNAHLDGIVRERTDELRTQSALLEAVLDQLPLGVVIVDASGRVTRASRYARELLGARLRAAEITSYDGFGLTWPDGRPVTSENGPLARALWHGEATVNARVELEAGPTERRSLLASATPIRDERGRTVAAAVVFEDVTERDRREQAERDFVTNAAHELRTPLAAIAGAVEVLQAGAKEQPTERDLFLSHIERESARLARLARALLLLARAQMGAEAPKLEIVPVRPLLQGLVRDLRPAPGVEVSIRCGRGVAALANGELLEQALINLAGNAARYTETGSIRLAARTRAGETTIEVHDTGPGLSKAAQALAFERFYREGRRDDGGFGLGLAIAKQAVETIGGAIELESEEGRRTVVRVRVPAAKLLSE